MDYIHERARREKVYLGTYASLEEAHRVAHAARRLMRTLEWPLQPAPELPHPHG